MTTFPLLRTGAVTQYPLQINTGQASQVIRFLDGSDQRYLMQGRMLRQWQIKLDLLNEDEMQALESFFAGQLGDYEAFTFTDPYTGTSVPNCRFATPVFATTYEAVDVTATTFWIVETNA